jgi:hypothetical protein
VKNSPVVAERNLGNNKKQMAETLRCCLLWCLLPMLLSTVGIVLEVTIENDFNILPHFVFLLVMSLGLLIYIYRRFVRMKKELRGMRK